MNQSQQYLSRQCPVCQKQTKTKIEISSEKKAEDMSYEELTPYWNGFFKEKIFFSYACRNNFVNKPIIRNATRADSYIF